VRYFGIPAGYEFARLLEALFDVSSGSTDLSEATRRALRGLNHDIHLQVFVTPTCPYCPRAVRLAHKLAVESERVIADAVEAIEFPELSHRYNVYGVPKTVINETRAFEGALPEAFFVHNVLEEPAPAERAAAPAAHG
jgi:glutaredoxin-like protein